MGILKADTEPRVSIMTADVWAASRCRVNIILVGSVSGPGYESWSISFSIVKGYR